MTILVAGPVWSSCGGCAVMMRNYSVLIMRTKTTPEDSNRNDRTRIMNKDSVANEENIILNSWQTIPSNTYHDCKFFGSSIIEKINYNSFNLHNQTLKSS